MSLPFTVNIKTAMRFSVKDGRLRAAAIVFTAFLVLDLLLYGVFIAPSVASLAAWEAKYAELRRRHAEAVLFKNQKSSFTGIMSGIPAQKDMPLLVKDLVQTARRLNLSVSLVKYDIPKRASGELAMLAFSFPAEGRYADLKRFVYDVETSDRLVGIQEMKMDADQGRVKMEMKLLTYIKEQ
jgi:Tfp pilus assembly protein PilO